MKRKIILITSVMLLLFGCNNYYMISSLNPFYTEKYIILDQKVEGSWTVKALPANKDSAVNNEIWGFADTTSTWVIKRHISKNVVKDRHGADSTTWKPENFYIAQLRNPSDSSGYQFKVVLFRVKNGLYADFMTLNKEELLSSKLAINNFFEVHTLARVSFSGNRMNLSWLGADCVKDMIENKRVRVKYQWVNETGKFVLTASSKDLCGMIERYADQPRFIEWDDQKAILELTRIKAEKL